MQNTTHQFPDPRNHKLQSVREGHGLTQTRLAALAGTTPTRICQAEAGILCRKEMARRIADALGVDPVEVFENFNDLKGA